MTTILGGGDFEFSTGGDWGNLPTGWTLGEVAAVAVDADDNVYVFQRGEHPLIVFDRSGEFVRSWGEGVLMHPHGLHIAPDGTIFCTDDGDHSVRQYSPGGELLLTIGDPGHPAAYQSQLPFNRCTHTAVTPNGDILVTDGYGNARVHRYAPDGRLIGGWGSPGSGPGEFNLPHNIVCDPDGWVYVADRENHRIQIFDSNGEYQTQWNNLHRPSGLHLAVQGDRRVLYVGEVGPYLRSNVGWPNVGPRVSILSGSGDLIGRLDSPVWDRLGPGAFVSPHGIALDSHGDIYLADVCFAGWPQLFPGRDLPPEGLRGLHRLTKVTAAASVA